MDVGHCERHLLLVTCSTCCSFLIEVGSVGFLRYLTTVKSQCHDALRKLRDVVPAPGTSGDGLVTGMEANP